MELSKTNRYYIKASLLLELFVLCLIIALYVAIKTPATEGLERLFLLPCGFAISLALFWKEYCYCKNSVGLLLLYSMFAVRYCITPLLIAASQALVLDIDANKSDYQMSILILLFELYVSLLAIKLIWPSHLKKKQKITEEKISLLNEKFSFKFTWSGALIVLLLCVLLFGRGHFRNVFEHLSTWFRRETNHDVLYTNDMIAFNVLKSVAFIWVVSLMQKVYERTNLKRLPVVLAMVAAAANTMWYQYNERTDLAILIISSLLVLNYAFPKYKKFFVAIFGIGGVALLTLVFLEGTLHYSVGESLDNVGLESFEKMAQLYVTGPTMLANAHMNYTAIRSQMSISVFFKDLVESLEFLSVLPFTRGIVRAVASTASTGELYAASIGNLPYILPNYSLACLYASEIFGWILDIVVIFVVIRLVAFLELRVIQRRNLAFIYALISMVVRVSMAICCNNFMLMIHAVTINPLWIYGFAWVNEIGRKYPLKFKT